ncbi:MAG: hypothetical protein K8R58_06675 [Bacteroidales bacterium]|nr:hypothetical protein [Bacteroidales bacterium]
MIDWNSFWTNILAGTPYFVLGIIFSVWLIPKFTLRLLRNKNRKHFRKKVAFLISEICNFFNGMPSEFKVNDKVSVFNVRNENHPDLYDFVAILKPDLFQPTAIEKTIYFITKTVSEYKGEQRYVLVEKEIRRFDKLLFSMENIIGVHSLNFDDKLINNISVVCFEIRKMINEFQFNETFKELKGSRDGIFGASSLKDLYEKLFHILKDLSVENGIKKTFNTTSNTASKSSGV